MTNRQRPAGTASRWIHLPFLAALGCGGESAVATQPPSAPPVVAAELTLPGGSLVLGDSMIARVVGRDASGAAVSGAHVTWMTSDSTILNVSSTGVLRGHASGIAVVTAAFGSIAATARVCVRGQAARATVVTGEAQLVTVQSTFPVPAVIRIADVVGNVIPCLAVQLKAGPSDAVVSPDTATSDAQGIIHIASWTASKVAGPQTVTITSAEGVIGAVHATGVPGPATSIKIVGGDTQTVVLNRTATQSLDVQVRDAFGNAIVGAPVVFLVTPISAATVANGTTDNAGVARTAVKLNAIGDATIDAALSPTLRTTFHIAGVGMPPRDQRRVG